MKTKDPLPDILDPSAHVHDANRDVARVIEKNWWRTRRYIANVTPRAFAKNFYRSYIGNRYTDESLIEMDHSSSSAYYSISSGPTCASLPYGKVRVKLYGQKAEIFQVRELLKEIHAEKTQPRLFNI